MACEIDSEGNLDHEATYLYTYTVFMGNCNRKVSSLEDMALSFEDTGIFLLLITDQWHVPFPKWV